MRRWTALSGVLVILLLMLSGCKINPDTWQKVTEKPKEPELIKVELVFTDRERMTCYVKGMGIEDNGQVYVGGSSVNYMYDRQGNIIGAFNYQRLIYMKLIPEGTMDH